MRRARVSRRRVLAVGTLALAAWLAPAPGRPAVSADERPKTSSAVQVPVQGGAGVEPVPGAPPPVRPSLEPRKGAGTTGGPRRSSAARPVLSLRAVSTADGEAEIERDGVREVVRPGARLGGDTVKSVAPGRLVLERPATASEPEALVVVTFDEAGRGRAQVFWAADPSLPKAPEVKRP
jgi:hypothetical protein